MVGNSMDQGATGWAVFLGIGFGSCFGVLLLVFNLWSAFRFFTDGSAEKPSSLSLAAWGLSLAGALLGPCGAVLAIVAFGLARYEQGRIYNEESTVRSTTPCELATVNSLIALVAAFIGVLVILFSVVW